MIYYRYPSYHYPPPVMPNIKSQNPRFYSNGQGFKSQQSSSTKKQFQDEPQAQVRKEIKENPNKSNENALFEIFGIKLYFDDILLICLIFFLYNEGVQDQYLFIVLILLLLS